MKDMKCPECDKQFSYESMSGKVSCPHCWARLTVEIVLPEELNEEHQEELTEEEND